MSQHAYTAAAPSRHRTKRGKHRHTRSTTPQHSTHHRLPSQPAHHHTSAYHSTPRTQPQPSTTQRTHRLQERAHRHTGAQAPTGACRRGLGERHPSVTTPETTCDHQPLGHYTASTHRAQPPQGLMGLLLVCTWVNSLIQPP